MRELRSLGSRFGAFVLACALAAPAAGVELAAGGGGFFPWDGDSGPAVFAQVGGRIKQNWRLLGEFEYRDYSTKLLGVDNVDVQGYGLRFVAHYMFLPEGVVNPYVGAGVGLTLQDLDDQKIERALEQTFASADVTPVALSVAVMGILGLELPLGDHFALFGEGRVGADIALTNTEVDTGSGNSNNNLDTENLGGLHAIGGLRVRW